ncbi:hypothetical protein KQX54_016165 [Cotesia glomerata]|uniref:Uncharacterized protein n=1 Tax=Cotesia glomerata TaxID=32391 RepID=A0AAV7IA03_COTGL|nr:hypothetical protein KQX54_016165 [Cotesia glomerata]
MVMILILGGVSGFEFELGPKISLLVRTSYATPCSKAVEENEESLALDADYSTQRPRKTRHAFSVNAGRVQEVQGRSLDAMPRILWSRAWKLEIRDLAGALRSCLPALMIGISSRNPDKTRNS